MSTNDDNSLAKLDYRLTSRSSALVHRGLELAGRVDAVARGRTLLDLRGYFVLPELEKLGQVRRLGRGCVLQLIAVDDRHILSIAKGGATLFDDKTGEALWEIDCPTSGGAVSVAANLLALRQRGLIHIWDLRIGRRTSTIESAGGGWYEGPPSLAFSPNGNLLAFTSRDKAHLWSTMDRSIVKTIESQPQLADGDVLRPGEFATVSFSPDGHLFCSGEANGAIRLWRVPDCALIRTVHGPEDDDTHYGGAVCCVAFSPDGRILASAGEDDWHLALWRLSDYSLARTCDGGIKTEQWITDLVAVKAIVFSPDSKMVACSFGDWVNDGNHSYVKIWNTNTGKVTFSEGSEEAGLSGATFLPNGDVLVSTAPDYQFFHHYIYDEGTESATERAGRRLCTMRKHTSRIRGMAQDSNGQRLATWSDNHILFLWSAGGTSNDWDDWVGVYKQNEARVGFEGFGLIVPDPIHAVAFSPQGDALGIATSWDHRVQVREVASIRDPRMLEPAADSQPSCATFTPDGSALVAGFYDGSIRAWGMTDGGPLPTVQAHQGVVTKVAFSANQTLLASASGSGEKTVKIWSLDDGRLIPKWRIHTAANDIVFSPSGKYLAIASVDGRVRLLRTSDGNFLWTFQDEDCPVDSIDFSPDERVLASGSSFWAGGGKIHILDAASGRSMLTMEAGLEAVTSVRFCGDAGMLASASMDGTVRLWRINV